MKLWVRDVLERVISSAAEASVALITADQISSAFALDWKAVAGVAGLTAVVTALKSLAALKANNTISPASLTK